MNLSPEKKIAGVLVPLFALRGENDLGIGDLGALREFIDWTAEIGFTLVQVLRINETGADNSPYNAISSMAIEPTTLYLAPDSPAIYPRKDFDAALSEINLTTLRRGSVKYRQDQRTKAARILEKAFANFSARADEKRRSEFDRFCEEESVLVARLRIVPRSYRDKTMAAPPGTDWPPQHQTIESAKQLAA